MAVINEVIRLYPPIPFNVRLSTEGSVLPAVNGGKPLYVPPNTTIVWCNFLIQRREDLWGPDAHIFDPDRFLDERLDKYLNANPTIYMPFSAGPRSCLGQQFAISRASYITIRLLQAFDGVTLDTKTQKMPPADWAQAKGRKSFEKVFPRSHISLYIEDGLWIRMNAVDSESA